MRSASAVAAALFARGTAAGMFGAAMNGDCTAQFGADAASPHATIVDLSAQDWGSTTMYIQVHKWGNGAAPMDHMTMADAECAPAAPMDQRCHTYVVTTYSTSCDMSDRTMYPLLGMAQANEQVNAGRWVESGAHRGALVACANMVLSQTTKYFNSMGPCPPTGAPASTAVAHPPTDAPTMSPTKSPTHMPSPITPAPTQMHHATPAPTQMHHASMSPTVMHQMASPSPTQMHHASMSPTVMRQQGSLSPTLSCQDDATFHVKDCPDCNCQWFNALPNERCPKYGGHQGVVRDTRTGAWHKGATACCACQGGIKATTAMPTAALFAPVPAVPANGGVHGCADLAGKDWKTRQAGRAFYIKGCTDCTCDWISSSNRCSTYGGYTGGIRGDHANVMKATEACCTCGGGQR